MDNFYDLLILFTLCSKFNCRSLFCMSSTSGNSPSTVFKIQLVGLECRSTLKNINIEK